jgi:hypothetical protein
MPLWDQNFITKEIAAIGETVTVRVVTVDSTSDWGDNSLSTADTTSVKAVMRVMTQDDDLVKEGIFQRGDIAFYFSGAREDISRGNRIVYDSTVYEITETIERYLEGTTHVIIANTKVV